MKTNRKEITADVCVHVTIYSREAALNTRLCYISGNSVSPEDGINLLAKRSTDNASD